MASWRWPLVLLVWVGLAGPSPLRAQAEPPVPMPKELPLEVAVADVQPEDALASASFAPAPAEAARPPALTYPLKRFAASMDPWGWRYSQRRGAWRMHTGVDLAADEGTPVLAASAGRVLLVESIFVMAPPCCSTMVRVGKLSTPTCSAPAWRRASGSTRGRYWGRWA